MFYVYIFIICNTLVSLSIGDDRASSFCFLSAAGGCEEEDGDW